MKKEPLVSILMTCYNHENFVAQAIESCLNQNYKNIEIIISDDYSSDRSADIIKNYKSKYPDRIVFLEGKINIGLTPNLNRALAHCKGEYLAFTSADDVLLPQKISMQISEMLKNDEVAICYHDVIVFENSTSRILYKISDRYKSITGDLKTILTQGLFFSCLGCLVRRDAIPIHGYDESIRLCSDWFFMTETIIKSEKKILALPGSYALYRRHDRNITQLYRNKLIDEELKAIDILGLKYPEYTHLLSLRKETLTAMKVLKLMTQMHLLQALNLLKHSINKKDLLLRLINLGLSELLWRIRALKYWLFNQKIDNKYSHSKSKPHSS